MTQNWQVGLRHLNIMSSSVAKYVAKRPSKSQQLPLLVGKIIGAYDVAIKPSTIDAIARIIAESAALPIGSAALIGAIHRVARLIGDAFHDASVALPPSRQDWIAGKLADYLAAGVTSSSTIVDIGGGEGHVLRCIGEAFSIPQYRLICVEQAQGANNWAEEYKSSNATRITYQYWDWTGAAPVVAVDPGTVDVALIMVALHHMDDATVNKVLTGVHRALRPGGRLIIKEHDITTDEALNTVHWEHHLYHIMESGTYRASSAEFEREWRDYFACRYVTNFKSRRDWNAAIGCAGFEHLEDRTRLFDRVHAPTHVKFDAKNLTDLYWQIWRRATDDA